MSTNDHGHYLTSATAGRAVRPDAYLTTIIGNISSHYLDHDLGHLRVGTSKSDFGDLLIEDMVAIPDLAAGAVSEIMRKMVESDIRPIRGMMTPSPTNLTAKSKFLHIWLAARNLPLQRETIAIDLNTESPGMMAKHLRFEAIAMPSALIRP